MDHVAWAAPLAHPANFLPVIESDLRFAAEGLTRLGPAVQRWMDLAYFELRSMARACYDVDQWLLLQRPAQHVQVMWPFFSALAHQPVTVITFRNPDGSRRYATILGLNFGLGSVALQFNRCPQLIVAIENVCALVAARLPRRLQDHGSAVPCSPDQAHGNTLV